MVYPLNLEAARNIGVRFDSPPEKTLRRAGLRNDVKGTFLDQLGFEEFESVRKSSGDSPFPSCQ